MKGDSEVKVMEKVLLLIEPLSPESRMRVLMAVAILMDIPISQPIITEHFELRPRRTG